MFNIAIVSENKDGKKHSYIDHATSLHNAVRMVLTFKPKRGYKVIHYQIKPCKQEVNLFDFAK